MPSVGDIMAGRAFVLLYAHDTPLYRGLQMAERRVQQFAYTANRIGRSMLTVATAVGAPLAYASKTFADFQDQMLAVRAVTRATADEYGRLYDQAKKLGAETSFTAGQVAGGQLSLGRQGFSPAEIEAAIPAVLNLARATGTDLAIAADIASGTLRAFNMQAREMPRIADVMVATANNSAQTLEDLGESMKYVAPIAYQYGLSVEQTAKALGVLANMQIKGTMAGTSLRQIMLQLADAGVRKRLHDMGIEVVDLASGKLRPLGDVMIEIGKKMATMGQAERISLGKELFDQRAVGAALTLAQQDFDGLSDAIENAAGVAERTAEGMDSGLGGVLRILLSAVEGVQIAIGEALQEKLRAWGTSATELAGKVQKWIEVNRDLIVTVAKIVAGLAAFGVAAIAVGSVAGSIAATINLVSMAVGALNTALAVSPLTLWLAALTAVGVALYGTSQHTARLYSEMKELLEANDQVRKSEQERFDELAKLAESQDLSSSQMQTAKSIIAELTEKYGDLGVKVNEAAGAIEGMADGQKRLNEAQSAGTKVDLEAAIAEQQANIQALLDEMQSDAAYTMPWEYSWGWLKDLSDPAGEHGIFEGDQKQLEAREVKIGILKKELDATIERYRRLFGGDEKALTGGAGDVKPEQSEGRKQREADRLRFARISELAGRQSAGLTSAEAAEAAMLVDELSERYGDLGIRVVKAAGRILGLKDAQEQFNATQKKQAEQERLDEIAETLGMGKAAAGAGGDGVVSEEEEKRKAEEIEKLNAEMHDRIAEANIQRIKDEQNRTIAEINRRYEAERKKAEELGASLSLVEEARKAALATADEKYRQRKEEEKNRQQEAAAASNQRMRDEIARIGIEKQSGDEIDKAKAAGASLAEIKALELDRDKKLLELDRQRDLRNAKKDGSDPAIVNEMYDAQVAWAEQQAKRDVFADIRRGQMALEQRALAPTAGVGSLEAYQAFARNASADPAQRIREKQLRKLDDIDRNTQRAADAAEEFGVIEVGIDLSG